MSNEIKEKEEYEKYARDHRKELDAQEVKLGDVVTVLVGHFAGEKGVIVGMIACDKSDYADPYYEIEMECDVPEEYKCRKTLLTPNNVIGGLSAHEFEVIGNRAPKQPSMEIKQGDRVRVSEDAPKMYLRGFAHIFTGVESVVSEVEDDNAVIIFNTDHINSQTTIPTKYLVKVDAEAKEAKYHKDDKVCINNSSLKHGLRGEILTIIGVDVSDRTYYVQSRCMRSPIWLREDEISPYTEPTEQTEVEKKPNVGSIKIPVEVDLADSYWDAYTADLAKEVALKVANKFNDPEETAYYVVKLAKEVVEGLKKK